MLCYWFLHDFDAVGCDAWMDKPSLDSMNVSSSNLAKGFTGTVPWQTHSLELEEYTDEATRKIVNKSIQIYNAHSQFSTSAITAIYGYDAMFTLVNAINIIEKNPAHKLPNLIDDSKLLIELLNKTITGKVDFIGATGRVIFDMNGDRIKGLYSFANVIDNGNVQFFGYFYQNDSNGSVVYHLDVDKIVWPEHFSSKNMTPRTNVLYTKKQSNIHIANSSTMIVLLSVSCIVALISMIFVISKKKNIIIKAASWRMNIIMCSGAIIGYLGGIAYGMDEKFIAGTKHKAVILDVLCNIRLWMVMIAFSLLFMPLFAKTYRLSLVFKAMLTKTVVKDTMLFVMVLVCVLVDILLLTIFTSIKPLQRVYLEGDIETIDELRAIQHIHGVCDFSEDIDHFNWSFYAFLLFFKLCELVWGLWVALDVSRIKDITNMLGKFDETGIWLYFPCTFISVYSY